MKQCNTTTATVRALFSSFSARYLAAHNAEVAIENKAHEAFVAALAYLEYFTSGDNGLTPAQAKELYQLLEFFEGLWGTTDDLAPTSAHIVELFETEIRMLTTRSAF